LRFYSIRYYEHTLHIIPEYSDLQARLKMTKCSEERNDIHKKLNSYSVFMAIYNWKTRQIEHYHYGVFDWLLEESGYDMMKRKNEIASSIHDYMKRFEFL
jgi:hypothetical protein